MEKTDLRVVKTKKALQNAFVETLSKKPFTKITVDEVCKKANVNRMTFYNHYQDKYDLLNDIINAVKEHLIDSFMTNTGGEINEENVIKYLMNKCERTIDICLKYKNFIFMLAAESDNSLAQYIVYNSLEQGIINILEQMTSAFKFDNAPIQLLASFLTGGISSIVLNWIQHKEDYTKDELVKVLKEFIEAAVLILHKYTKK